jgi:cell division protein ZipA
VDIKDFILIGGGLLIAAVVAHGFWIAWRARREPLRLDIVPNMFPQNVDDIEWLRGELPNGGARLKQHVTSGEQASLDLDSAPLLLEPSEPERSRARPVEPSVGRDLSGEGLVPETADVDEQPVAMAPEDRTRASEPEESVASNQRAKVAGVVIPAEEEPFVPEAAQRIAETTDRAVLEPSSDPIVSESASASRGSRELVRGPRRPRRLSAKPEPEPIAPAEQPVEELLTLNVLAPYGNRFTGAELFAALHGRGMKFGNMNIFHRVDPLTKMVQYSVANVVEPGTFDVADMDEFRSPGLCFFLQLPGPEQPADVLEDMFEVASAVSVDLRGELKDENRNFITQQMVEHYRQRIMDYTRRRMSKRA